MARGPGRDQRAPMERLVRIAAVLHAHGDRGVDGAELMAVAGFDGADAGSQLARELKHLRNQGWVIDSVGGEGDAGRYRMVTVDNRLTVRLDAAQQAALRKAVLLADRGDLARRLALPEAARPAEVTPHVPVAGHDEDLSVVMRAVARRALLTFTYKGTTRTVHPGSVRSANGTWYLRGREDGDEDLKWFVVSRMSDVDADAPGTADRIEQVRHPGLHPMTWEIDPPIEATLRTTEDYRADVERWLGEPVAVETAADHLLMRYVVTHRAAFRARLYELGRRVALEGPEEIRAEVLAELRRMAHPDDQEAR